MLTAIGLMSGTSMDGIDLAILRTDGKDTIEFGPVLAVDYPASMKRKIERGLELATQLRDRDDRPGALAELEDDITAAHALAVRQLLQANDLSPAQIDVIGFHGQTVLHRPGIGLTVQLGDGQKLADEIGCPVVFDMRANDMLQGGQGAPLVPVYHRALALKTEQRLPVAFVNIGGISNISYVGDDVLIAFDTGPGNALIDQWVDQEGGIPYDQGGRIASEGRVLMPIVERYLHHPFFEKAGPKSLDRNDFDPLAPGEAELSDGARTLARVSAEAIYKAVDHLPKPPLRWVICGGGRLNDTIMRDLADLAAEDGADVATSESIGLDGDMMEAQAFAYLAVRSLKGLPLTFPDTTGCKEPATGGALVRPRQGP